MPSSYDFYDYVGYWENRSFEDNCERLALEKLLVKIPEKKILVDIGGGFGRLASSYLPFFKKCLIIDPSVNLLKKGKEIYKREQKISFSLGSLPKLDLGDNSADCALLIRVVHHLKDPLPSFKEINRILKPKGFFIVEFANKIHFLTRLNFYCKGNLLFCRDKKPVDRRSEKSIKEKMITFVNHHPQSIAAKLEQSDFKIKEILSVSNLRSPLLKKILPKRLMLFIESHLQGPLAKVFFGPSIFILAQKSG